LSSPPSQSGAAAAAETVITPAQMTLTKDVSVIIFLSFILSFPLNF
jgi:hypothetical protein